MTACVIQAARFCSGVLVVEYIPSSIMQAAAGALRREVTEAVTPICVETIHSIMRASLRATSLAAPNGKQHCGVKLGIGREQVRQLSSACRLPYAGGFRARRNGC